MAVCLAPLTFGGAVADDNTDAARAAVRRTPTNTVTVTRQKVSEPVSNTPSISRSTNLSVKPNASYTERNRAIVSPRGDNNTVSTSESTRTPSVTARQPASVQVRTRTASQGAAPRVGTTTQSRSAITRASALSTPRVANTARTASTRAALSRSATKATVARAADTNSVATARTEMMTNTAKKCREVYYSCMDEFCANKDAVLKRCACSTRINEFDSTKKNLADVEDKMLEFNQRLLTVNMDKEDAEALYQATEGELAFNQKDTSQSKKMLDEIAKKLNTSFDDSNFDRSLSPISLSLNVDAAFDSIDSLQGASTTLKTGTELYRAALPVCREMAREVCTDDDLTIAESGYQMLIEQDCNTVAKSYQAQTDQARERVREGSALLDMSRLDIHQKRNSDDTLTCKNKMLDMLTDSSVCGDGMGKCLDVTGKYIDPSTGEAFLTTNLIQINNLITRPSGDETWTSAPGNNVFVSFLNSKKKFLEPAMENCQDIADTVWDAFIEDALAQIKLAQESKLEDMRQSCTTLTTQCLSDTAKSLADFDARALSIFGVKADKTVTAMCAEVTNACNALLLHQTGDDTDDSGGSDWVGGMTEIANANTYETILNTCREVGRACIVQVCTSISGNFGLCESIQSSINRKSIINRTACWNEVKNCVADAGTDKINEIMIQLGKAQQTMAVDSRSDFYNDIYNLANPLTVITGDTDSACTVPSITNKQSSISCLYDMCAEDCGVKGSPSECQICRIAEQIWGNCEANPKTQLSDEKSHNQILQPKDSESTLLWWFAQNTGTSNEPDSCRDTTCPAGFKSVYKEDKETKLRTWVCLTEGFDNRNKVCDVSSYDVTSDEPNCCPVNWDEEEYRDAFDNCLNELNNLTTLTNPTTNFSGQGTSISDLANKKLYIPGQYKIVATWNLSSAQNVTSNGITYKYPAGKYALICTGTTTTSGADIDDANGYPGGKTIQCSGTYVIVNLDQDKGGLYFTPGKPDAGTNYIESSNANGDPCHYSLTSGGWTAADGTPCPIPDPKNWRINITY